MDPTDARIPADAGEAPTVHFDAATLYLLARLGRWPGLDERLIATCGQALLDERLGVVATELKRLASSGMPRARRRFRRSALDICFASMMVELNWGGEFRSGDASLTAGYFELGLDGLRYIDRTLPRPRPYTHVLDPARVEPLLDGLRQAPGAWTRLAHANDDEAPQRSN